MKITNTAIKYRTSIVVLTVILVIGGLVSYITIPKEANPSIEVPTIVVTTIYSGSSPDDIESLISQPIEQEVQSINGIKELRSISSEGVSTVVVEFEPDVSMDDAFQKVRDKVDIAKAELPTEVEEPIVSEIDLSEFPIMSINLAGSYSLARLKEVAEDLQDELEAIPSILEVDLIGGLEREVQVNVDLNALQGYNLTFNDLIGTIQQENTNLPGGSVDVDRLNYLVRVDGEFDDPAEIENLVLDAPGGRPIYVRDVAEVVFGFKEQTTYARLQQFQAEMEDGSYRRVDQAEPLQVITLNVKNRTGENVLESAEQVNAVLESFPLPNGTEVLIVGDQSDDVRTLVQDLENNIIAGIIFVVAVLLFFLGVRTATLVGIAIPLSMFISFIVFSVMGQTLNFIILFSLIIALGMLVDNAVVIVENIYRFREQGVPRWEAARQGTAEVGGAVVASTATTVAAFAPMLLWPGIIGEFMSYMPLTLIITLSCSLFVALIINPVITGIFVKVEGQEEDEPKPRTRAARISIGVGVASIALLLALANWKTLLVLAVGIPVIYFTHIKLFKPAGDRFVSTGLPKLVARYRAFLSWMLTRDYNVKRPFLRNTLALGSFTGGFVLLILAGIVSALMGQTAGFVFLIPGAVLLVVGVVGFIVHALENLYLGGWKSVKAGVVALVIFGGLATALFLAGRIEDPIIIAELLLIPIIIILAGSVGGLFNRSGRTQLLLTDNRARLLTTTMAALIVVLGMFAIAPTGVEFFPDTDPNQVIVEAEAPLGTNIDASDVIATELETRITSLVSSSEAAQGNLENVLVGVGVGGDVLFGGGSARPENSRVTLNMVEYGARAESSGETLRRLREQLQGVPGVNLEFTKEQQGPPTGAPVNLEITGEDFGEITRIAGEINQMLTEASETGLIPGLVDVADDLDTGRPELRVDIDRERAAQFGLNTNQIATTVRAAINGIEASKYRTGDDEYDITVRLREADRQTLEAVSNLTILYEGSQIPISAVADFQVSGGLGNVTRLDLQRVATVTADAAPGFNGNAVLASVQAHLGDYVADLPPGYAVSYTGESEDQEESFSFLTTALLIGVALIFMIMVAQFNGISGPFIIIVAVGLSLIGVLLGLILTRTPFGLMTFIGVISLAGIVVNNAIVLVDYIMQLRGRGLDKQEAVIEAGATRLRPVLLTALTTIIGLIPLTFGINIDFVGLLTNLEPNFQFGSENTQFWGPMGTAIISGLTFGTFLTLVIVPVMYSTFDSVSLKLSTVFAGPRRAEDGMGVSGDGFTNVSTVSQQAPTT
ncbi:MAG: efflux RND transporter permease subunit [Bacteroidota bacterium]